MICVYPITLRHHGYGGFNKRAESACYENLDGICVYLEEIPATKVYRPIEDTDPAWERVFEAYCRSKDEGYGTVVGWKDEEGKLNIELVCEE